MLPMSSSLRSFVSKRFPGIDASPPRPGRNYERGPPKQLMGNMGILP
jgi:hypothetical protein